MGLIPAGWLDYTRIGKKVLDSRFIAFKVPLTEHANKVTNTPADHQLYPQLLTELVPQLGMVIDLTNTKKYYSPQEFEEKQIRHKKILTEGKTVPSESCYREFREAVKEFYEENNDNDKLVGVHCTHGLNRTGFMVCRYMIQELHIPPDEAITGFQEARGHDMKYETFLAALRRYRHLPALAIDSNTDKARGRNNGPQVNLAVRRDELLDTGYGGYIGLFPNDDIRTDSYAQRRRPHYPYEPNRATPTNTSYRGSIQSPSQLSNSYRPDRSYPSQHGYQQRNRGPSNNSHTPENLLGRNQQYQSRFSSNDQQMGASRSRPSRFEPADSNRQRSARFDPADMNWRRKP